MKEEIKSINNKDNTLSNCVFTKTVLMLIVVLYHCIAFWTGEWFTYNPKIESNGLLLMAKWLNSFQIYAFTLVSGYVFYYIKYEKGKYNQYIPFIINKGKRLLVPYIFVAIFWVIPIQYFFFKYDFSTIVHNYILVNSPNQLWFLPMLFLVFAIFRLVSDHIKNNKLEVIIIISFYLLSIITNRLFGNIFMISRALEYYSVFWLGFKFRECNWENRCGVSSFILIILDVLLFFINLYFGTVNTIWEKILSYGVSYITHLFGAFMAFIVLCRLSRVIKWENSTFFLMLTKYTMPIYLIHQQIVYFFIWLLNGKVMPITNALIAFVGTMSLSIIISSLIMRFNITRILIGEKK